MKIIVDAMGGDNAPLAIVKGALEAQKALRRGHRAGGPAARSILRGSGGLRAKDAARRAWRSPTPREVVEMCDDPATAFKQEEGLLPDRGPEAAERRRRGTPWSPPAPPARCSPAPRCMVKRIRGIRRAAMAPVIPTATGRRGPHRLRRQRRVYAGVSAAVRLPGQFLRPAGAGRGQSPGWRLLNIGAEDSKGTDLQQADAGPADGRPASGATCTSSATSRPRRPSRAAATSSSPTASPATSCSRPSRAVGSFAGSALKDHVQEEPADTSWRRCCVMAGLNAFKDRLDPNKVGGTAFIGISKPVIKAHGASNAEAIENAVGQAIQVARSGIMEDIRGRT